MNITSLIERLPKAELHLHIEGTLEPELMMALAERNQVTLPYASVEDARAAYNFSDLQSFLDLYHIGTQVLKTEQDFYDMTWAYLTRVAEDNVRHVELFTDTQTHTDRGISTQTVINGIDRALQDGQTKLGISGVQILCFLRHLSEAEAMQALEDALPFKDKIGAVGLASSELGHPPSKFKNVFARARKEGLVAVAHAGEEGPPEYIHEALDLLQVVRIDHGVRCLEDPELVARLVKEQVPLTVCPLSNLELCVFDSLEQHNLKQLMDAGLCVTINSDDPAYFGGYMNDNYLRTQQALNLTAADMIAVTRNAFNAAFIDDDLRRVHLSAIDQLEQEIT
ncbi:MAG: adenosine deaminase [Gammaproteobacteria bacterium]